MANDNPSNEDKPLSLGTYRKFRTDIPNLMGDIPGTILLNQNSIDGMFLPGFKWSSVPQTQMED